MNKIRKQARENRRFLPPGLEIRNFQDIERYIKELTEEPVGSANALKNWLLKRSELESVLEEDKAWLYINQSCHTDNETHAKAFSGFVREIDQQYARFSHRLNLKLYDYCLHSLYPPEYDIFVRAVRREIELYREENIPLMTELEVEEQKYGSIAGAMTIVYDGKEHTLQQAQNFLKLIDRKIRKEVFGLIGRRRSEDFNTLNSLFGSLLKKRHQLAVNAGFKNYLEYRFAKLGRFDYTIADCREFHDAVEKQVVPAADELLIDRKNKLELETLFPYDLEVDPDRKPPLKPFGSVNELIKKSIACLSEVDAEFGRFLEIMSENGYLDLDSRKGKAPGGYNYPLHESNVPFIFMNATNNLRDMETMMHESGHAIHAFLSKDLEFVYYKEVPAEIAEVASMAMELISMEHWHHFFTSEDDLKRAKKSQLEGVVRTLPWVATIDKFQHWLYTHPGHSEEERTGAWSSIEKAFGGSVTDWSGYEIYRKQMWQKQIHLYQFPLYYIEYGIAQLGAVAIWKNYKENREKTLKQFRKALSLGYSKTLPELYQAAGIGFDFSSAYIQSLMDFVMDEIRKLG
jgi:oligoendopeptidase F